MLDPATRTQVPFERGGECGNENKNRRGREIRSGRVDFMTFPKGDSTKVVVADEVDEDEHMRSDAVCEQARAAGMVANIMTTKELGALSVMLIRFNPDAWNDDAYPHDQKLQRYMPVCHNLGPYLKVKELYEQVFDAVAKHFVDNIEGAWLFVELFVFYSDARLKKITEVPGSTAGHIICSINVKTGSLTAFNPYTKEWKELMVIDFDHDEQGKCCDTEARCDDAMAEAVEHKSPSTYAERISVRQHYLAMKLQKQRRTLMKKQANTVEVKEKLAKFEGCGTALHIRTMLTWLTAAELREEIMKDPRVATFDELDPLHRHFRLHQTCLTSHNQCDCTPIQGVRTVKVTCCGATRSGADFPIPCHVLDFRNPELYNAATRYRTQMEANAHATPAAAVAPAMPPAPAAGSPACAPPATLPAPNGPSDEAGPATAVTGSPPNPLRNPLVGYHKRMAESGTHISEVLEYIHRARGHLTTWGLGSTSLALPDAHLAAKKGEAEEGKTYLRALAKQIGMHYMNTHGKTWPKNIEVCDLSPTHIIKACSNGSKGTQTRCTYTRRQLAYFLASHDQYVPAGANTSTIRSLALEFAKNLKRQHAAPAAAVAPAMPRQEAPHLSPAH